MRKQGKTEIDLQHAIERLRAIDRSRMEFVSNVSHELRTPLTSMIYALNNMLRGVVGPLPERAIQYLERMSGDCNRMLATVNDLLDMRQIETHTMILSRCVYPLRRIVINAIDALRVQAETKGVKIRPVCAAGEAFVNCDVEKMMRVMINIIGNAIKFTPYGGSISLDVSVAEDGRSATVLCADTGPGVPPEKLPRISERYYRVGSFVSGTGLGLSISREIIELHGGEISFASPVPGSDCGTAVYVKLPTVTAPLILACSRWKMAAEFLARKVEICGYRTVLCDEISHCTERCAAEQPAAVIIGSDMPREELRELILQLRENGKTKRLPVVVLGRRAVTRNEDDFYKRFNVYYASISSEPERLAAHLAAAMGGDIKTFVMRGGSR